jgi:capsular polysaccharide transport system permease protein
MIYDREKPDFSPLNARPQKPRLESAWQIQRRIWLAVMLRDLRSRFFGNGLGWVILVAWPVAHVSILVLMHSIRDNVPPYGDSSVVFYMVGFLPFLTFVYMSRYTMIAVISNAALMSFPVVKPLDLAFGHIFLEIVNSFLVWIVIILALTLTGFDMTPRNIVEAFAAYGACLLLGVGFALCNAMIAQMFRPWVTGYVLIIICLYFTSGALILPEEAPTQLQKLMVLNPIFHGVEWMRSAYYPGYGADLLEKWYILSWGVGSLLLGLFLDRFVRNRVLRIR